MSPRRASPKSPAYMAAAEHRRLWRMVEGAVVDAFRAHPEYLTAKGNDCAVQSITKRVVGQLVGHAKGTREGGGLGRCWAQAADQSGAAHLSVHSGQDGRGQDTAPGHASGRAP